MNLNPDSLLGIFFLIIGAVLWLSVRMSFREFTFGSPKKVKLESPVTTDSNDENSAAVLFVKNGGQLKSISKKAREIFAIQENQSVTLNSIALKVSPSSRFYSLCTEAGEDEVEIDHSRYICTSLSMGEGTLLIFKQSAEENHATLPAHDETVMNQIAELSMAISTSIDLEQITTTFLKKLSAIIPADLIEINVWDDDVDFLLPFRIQKGINENKPFKAEAKNKLGEGISGKIIQTNEMIWIGDLAHSALSSANLVDKELPYASLLGFPLIVDHEVLGTLELYGLKISAFDDSQKGIIAGVIPQLSAVINNSILFKLEKQKAAELKSLAQLAQSANFSREPEKIFEHMLATISPMLSLEMIGFLLFNENQQLLSAQSPFIGLPAPFVEIFKTEIAGEGKAKKLITAQDVLITENAETDLHWMTLGLDHIARAASIREAVLIPLLSSGRSLGFLMAANHKNANAVFSQLEMHSLMIVANQAAPIIDNMILVQQSHQRAQRAEILRQIALYSNSSASLDEIIGYTVEQLSRLLNGNCGAIFLLDSKSNFLQLQPNTTCGNAKSHLLNKFLEPSEKQFQFTSTHTLKPIVLGRFDESEPVIPFYQQLIDTWKLKSVLIFPLIVQGEGIGELWIGSEAPNQYDVGDIQALNPAVEQLVGVIDQSMNRDESEDHFKVKAEKLTSQAKIMREIFIQSQLNDALDIIAREAIRLSSAETFSIVILEDRQNENIGSFPKIMRGEKLDEKSIHFARKLAEKGKIIYSDEINDDDENKFLFGGKESIIYLPFSVEDNYWGALFLYTRGANKFSKMQFDSVQAFLVQTLPAFEKVFAQWRQENQILSLNKKLAVQNRLFSLTQRITPQIPLNFALEPIAADLLSEFSFLEVSIYAFDEEQRIYREIFTTVSSETHSPLAEENEIAWEDMEVILNPKYRCRECYIIPPDKNLSSTLSSASSSSIVEDDNILLCPIHHGDGMPSGMVKMIASKELEMNDNSLDLITLYQSQIAYLFENDRNYKNNTEQLEIEKVIEDVDSENLVNSARLITNASSGPNFHNILSDATLMSVIECSDPQAALSVLAAVFLESEIFDTVIIFIKTDDHKIEIRLNQGGGINSTRLEALLGQLNPVTWVFEKQQPLSITSSSNDDSWANSPFLEDIPSGKIIFAPWKYVHKDAVLMLFTKNASVAIEEDQVGYLTQRLNFLSSFLEQRVKNFRIDSENIRLQRALAFGLTINKLDPAEVSESLLNHVRELVDSAQAGWVGYWNESSQEIKPAAAQGYKNNTALLRIKFSPDIWAIPIIVLEKGEPLRINDLNFVKNYPLPAEDHIHYQSASGGRLPISTLLVPLIHEDSKIGILVLENFDHPAIFDDEDEAVVALLGQQASSALANASVYQEKLSEALSLKQEHDHLETQLRIQVALLSDEEFEKTISYLLDLMAEVTHADLAILHLFSQGQSFQKGKYDRLSAEPGSELAQSLIGKIAQQLEAYEHPFILDELYQNKEWSDNIGPDFPFLSLLSYPLKYFGNEKAVLFFASTEPFQFTDLEQEFIGQIIPYLVQFLDHADLLKQLEVQKNSLSDLENEKNDNYQRSLAILGAMSDGVLIGDTENNITFINLAAQKILDLSVNKVQLSTIDSMCNELGQSLEGWKNTLQIWCKNPPVLNVDKYYTEKIILDSQRIISIQSSPVLYQMQLLGSLSIFRDITVEAQVDRMKSEFVANVSHELRTPLTSIKGYAELMLMGAAGQFNEQQKRFLNIIASNTTRLNVLVDNLLDISQIENEKINLDLRAVYLDKIIFQLVRDYQNLSDEEGKSIRIEMKIPKNMKPIWADEMRLQQILDILLNNSYHYSHERGRIVIRVSQTKNETQLDVQDFGIGIKQEIQDHIFERFFRGEEELVLSTAGTGLGLAVAKSLVEMQGGQIWFYSAGKDNEGSVFSFTVPVYVPEG